MSISTSDLRKLLFDTIADVRAGRIDHNKANAVSKLSGEILKSAKLDLDAVAMAKRLSTCVDTPMRLVGQQGAVAGLLEESLPEPAPSDPPQCSQEADTILLHFLNELPFGEREIIKNTRCKTARELAEYGSRMIRKQLGANAATANHIGQWLKSKFGLELAE